MKMPHIEITANVISSAPPQHSTTDPPSYTASSYMRSLREGDPDETISVPMIHTVQKTSLGDYVPFMSAGKVKRRTVIVRKMTRDCYLKHYAKDEEGIYVGTERPYPDAGLVFVQSKSTEADVLEQVSCDSWGQSALDRLLILHRLNRSHREERCVSCIRSIDSHPWRELGVSQRGYHSARSVRAYQSRFPRRTLAHPFQTSNTSNRIYHIYQYIVTSRIYNP
jgi:hypothetical protein